MIGTGEILVIFLAILLLFGGKKLPELARSLGQAMREFRAASSIDPSIDPSIEPKDPPTLEEKVKEPSKNDRPK